MGVRGGRNRTFLVDVYALEVERQLRKWAEAGQRSVLRCNVETALSLIGFPTLAILIEQYLSSGRPLRQWQREHWLTKSSQSTDIA